MIARVWHGVTTADKADEFSEYIKETGVPGVQGTAGNRSRLSLLSDEALVILERYSGHVCHRATRGAIRWRREHCIRRHDRCGPAMQQARGAESYEDSQGDHSCCSDDSVHTPGTNLAAGNPQHLPAGSDVADQVDFSPDSFQSRSALRTTGEMTGDLIAVRITLENLEHVCQKSILIDVAHQMTPLSCSLSRHDFTALNIRDFTVPTATWRKSAISS